MVQMHVIFNSKERTLREMTEIALSAGWQITGVIRKPEGSLFGSIIAIPISVPPSTALLSPFIEREIFGRNVGDTLYSRPQLPSLKGVVMAMNQSGSTVRGMMERLRKTISKTLGRSGQSGEEVGGRKGRLAIEKSASA